MYHEAADRFCGFGWIESQRAEADAGGTHSIRARWMCVAGGGVCMFFLVLWRFFFVLYDLYDFDDGSIHSDALKAAGQTSTSIKNNCNTLSRNCLTTNLFCGMIYTERG